ncbi:MAG: heme lyase CcmF/NrfE family subunit [Candidatus Berkiella sp.]
MTPELGVFSLILALMMSLVGFMAANAQHWRRLAFVNQLTIPAIRMQFLFILVSFATLMSCFAQDDFTLLYVAQNSHTTLPWIYKLCALWGAHEGSLLLWALILALWSFLLSLYAKKLPQNVSSTLFAVLTAISVGFLLLLLCTSNPFTRLLPFAPTDGADLNPLLQDPGFVLHPPFLYMGYVGLAVPFAFAICAMIHKTDNKVDFAALARPWALMAFAFLTVGITLGSWWAYYELGWGGWWFWDPVENASFMPWLASAALVHALYLSDKRKLFHAWSLLLALSAFILSLIGTFLVRSGVISSVHAFASDPLRGSFILGFIAIVIAFAFGLYLLKGFAKEDAKSPIHNKDSLMLFGNIILYVATLTVLLGTLYPILAQILFDENLSVGPPYFNHVFNPMMLVILALMAIAPHLKWQSLKLKFKFKLMMMTLTLLITLALQWLFDGFSWMAIIGLQLAVLLILSTVFIAFQGRGHFLKRGGMIFAHLGVGLSVLGIALSVSLETERELGLKVGQDTVINGYEFVFSALEDTKGANYEGVKATFEIKKNNILLYQAYPEKRYFMPRNLPMTETAIVPTLFKDFYIALGEHLENGSWATRIYIKPFIRFIWLGGLLVALGSIIASVNNFREITKRRA